MRTWIFSIKHKWLVNVASCLNPWNQWWFTMKKRSWRYTCVPSIIICIAFCSTLFTSHMITLLINVYDLWPSQGDAYESLPLHLEPLPAETEPPPPPGLGGSWWRCTSCSQPKRRPWNHRGSENHNASGLRAFITTSGVVSKDGKFNTTVTWWSFVLLDKETKV